MKILRIAAVMVSVGLSAVLLTACAAHKQPKVAKAPVKPAPTRSVVVQPTPVKPAPVTGQPMDIVVGQNGVESVTPVAPVPAPAPVVTPASTAAKAPVASAKSAAKGSATGSWWGRMFARKAAAPAKASAVKSAPAPAVASAPVTAQAKAAAVAAPKTKKCCCSGGSWWSRLFASHPAKSKSATVVTAKPAVVAVQPTPAAPTVKVVVTQKPATAHHSCWFARLFASKPAKAKAAVAAPAVAPAQPAPAPLTKDQRLAILLQQYMADQITPAQYHTQRAAIIAEP